MSSSSEYNGPGREEYSTNVRNFCNLSPSVSCAIPEHLSLLSFYKEAGCIKGKRKRLKEFITLKASICLFYLFIFYCCTVHFEF
jgi:hypothetical protein